MITIAVTVTRTGLAFKFPPILGLLLALTMTKTHTLQPGYYVEGVDVSSSLPGAPPSPKTS